MNQISFRGPAETAKLVEYLRIPIDPVKFAELAKNKCFSGITIEEKASREVQEALAFAKSQQRFKSFKKHYDTVLNTLI